MSPNPNVPLTGAEISPCQQYRYRLWRTWDPAASVLAWVMLNPSTADAAEDDPTIRRCLGYARAWGYGGIEVVNLFAYRATEVAAMKAASEPIGPDNDRILHHALTRASAVVCAWGVHGTHRERNTQVLELMAQLGVTPQALHITKDGHPAHPLYLSKTLLPRPF